MQSSKHREERSYYRGDRGGRRGNFDGDQSVRGRDTYGDRSARESPRGSGLRSPNISGDDRKSEEDLTKHNTNATPNPERHDGGLTIPEDSSSSSPTPTTEETPVKKSMVKSYHNLNLHRLNWETYHSFECKHGCRNERSHYTKWREAYEEHLWDLYSIFISEKVNLSKINYNLFTVFVYNNSSRFISEFD